MPLSDSQKQALQEIDSELGQNPRPYINRATQYDPDHQAEVIRLAEDRNLPLETVERNLKEVQSRERHESIDVSGYPKLSQFLSDDRNARVSIDDLDNLKGLEEALTPQMKPYEPTLWDRIKSLGGDSDKKRARASNERIAREIAKEEGISLDEVYWSVGGNRPLNPEGRPTGQAFAEGSDIVAAQLPHIPQAAINSVLKTIRGGDVEIEESILDTWITATKPPKPEDFDPNYESLYGIGESLGYSLITLTASATAGAVTAPLGPVASGASAFVTGGAVAYRASKDEFISRVKEALDEKSRRLYGRPLNQEEWDEALEEYEGAAIKYGAWEAIPEALSNLVFMRALSGPLKGIGRARLQEVTKRAAMINLSEQLTETMTGYGQSAAEEEAGIGKAKTIGQAFKAQFLPTAIVTTLLGGFGAGAKYTYNTIDSAISKRLDRSVGKNVDSMSEQEIIDQIVTYSQASKTKGRAQDRFSRFMEMVSGDQEVYIDAEAINEVIKTGEQVPDYVIEQLNGIGTDVAITPNQFAADFASNETLMQALRPHIKLNPDNLSANELGEDIIVKELMERAEKSRDIKTESDRIYEQVKEQLVQTGRQSEATARYSATIIPAYVAAKAEQTGISVKEIYKSMGLSIVGPVAEEKIKEKQGKLYYQDQPLSDMEVNIEAIEEETGRIITIKENAEVALKEANDSISDTKRLINCLRG